MLNCPDAIGRWGLMGELPGQFCFWRPLRLRVRSAGSAPKGEHVMSTRIRVLALLSLCLAALLLTIDQGTAQTSQVMIRPGVMLPADSIVLNPYARLQMIKPASSLPQPGRFHTHLLLAVPQGGFPRINPNITVGPPFAGYLFETPASLGCIYNVVTVVPGCNPNTVTTNPSGGTRAIAIVDAYDYPTAAADLATFNAQFGLAAADFTVIYGTGSPVNGCTNGTQPSGNTGWNLEAALDIEMAHAMAPGAKIYLVEATSNSYTDLFNAVQIATACIQAAGGGYISMSWGGAEFASETSYDTYFTGSNVIYFVSSGDNPGTEYPSVSPNVIAVGGTTINRNGTTGAFLSESVWNSDHDSTGTGGGVSTYEPRPAYQNFMSAIVGTHRGAPDLAADADPRSGVWVYNTTYCGGWCSVGGTSAAAPMLAALFDRAGFFSSSSYNLVSAIYGLAQSNALASHVTSITNGTCGSANLAGVYPGAYNPSIDPAYILAKSGIPWSSCVGWGTLKDSGTPNVVASESLTK